MFPIILYVKDLMEILRMRGKELNELTEEFMLAESKMNDLLP